MYVKPCGKDRKLEMESLRFPSDEVGLEYEYSVKTEIRRSTLQSTS